MATNSRSIYDLQVGWGWEDEVGEEEEELDSVHWQSHCGDDKLNFCFTLSSATTTADDRHL